MSNKLHEVIPVKDVETKFRIYNAVNPSNQQKYMSINTILILKIETNLKLNLINKNSMVEI